jgi:N-acetylglutamate synthase-like GNAT family acetyltransferase
MLTIHPYNPSHQPGIDDMMAGIATEFQKGIFSPAAVKISEVYTLPGHYYWTALYGEKVVGTTGLIFISENNAVLKRMMVDKNFRGPEMSTAKKLLNAGIAQARKLGTDRIFLGTMEQFKAAQRLYSREGFTQIPLDTIPVDMSINPLDTLYYRLDIGGL